MGTRDITFGHLFLTLFAVLNAKGDGHGANACRLQICGKSAKEDHAAEGCTLTVKDINVCSSRECSL